MQIRKAHPLIFFFIFFIYGIEGNAQQTENPFNGYISINVKTNVQATIQMVTIRNINFGKVQPGQKQIIISPINSPEAAAMKAFGIPNADIKITYLPIRELNRHGGNEVLRFYYSLSGNTENEQETSQLIDFNNQNTQFNGIGEYYFWIGGRVNIADAKPGQYEGDFTIEVEYL